MKELALKSINRIVIRGTNWVGDAMMTIPALRALRRLVPDARITLATRPWARGLFSDADFFDDELIDEDTGLRSIVSQARRWRSQKFDMALVFPNSFGAALIPALAGVPVRIGYGAHGRKFLLTHSLPLPEWRSSRHEVFYYLNIVTELEKLITGEKTIADQEPDFAFKIPGERRDDGLAFLRTQGWDEVSPLVALCPGSINSRAKRWPAERYAALADHLKEQLEARVLLIGSPEEIDVSRNVVRQMRHQPIVLTGKTDLTQTVAVLSNVDLLVTNDTGPAHIASALGTPTLVIFGPTNPLTTRPFSSDSQIIRHPPDCAPCMLRDCPIDHRCMTAISPEEVFERARVMLEEKMSGKLQFVASRAQGSLEWNKST